ncbi:PRTRC system ThiF family protein [Flavobacterium sp. MFBS3-15]|uniref:PRTRC system ThiF family protein n=1 Tax=Flavobacterium sp. MFBS3-15 TaxID=2989816 RepID=UPI002235C61F|nr:PRTRC system ThiF family protein [Flavobacterium sp. MFBS3-15]MCW4469826.1 PRTRC system ThiF family protein [Flavobacterium sp. MFBS3-15]
MNPTRCNRFFGTGWKAINRKYDSQSGNLKAAIYISCVDTVASRFEIAELLSGARGSHYANVPRYWMDFGNGKDTGQVVLSTIRKVKQPKSDTFEAVESLPFVTEEFGELLRQSETDDDSPSCSLAEALEKQELFINSALAQMGCSLLWQMFRSGMTTHRGLFLNIADFRAVPLPV